jgi:hypothetical protein
MAGEDEQRSTRLADVPAARPGDLNTFQGNSFTPTSEVTMEQSQLEQTDGLAAMGECRTDARQRRIVDAGIAVQGSSNTMSAFEFLRARDIGTDVIERVLLEPHRRRARS